MIRTALLAALLASASACSSAPQPRPEASAPGSNRAVVAVAHGREGVRVERDAFVVAIEATPLDFSTCRRVDVDEARQAIIVRGTAAGPPRSASVFVSRQTGETLNFSDTRGDFQPTLVDGRIVPPSGRVTSISINLADDLGVASNEGGDGPNERHVGTAAAFLQDEDFDLPGTRMSEILERCGA